MNRGEIWNAAAGSGFGSKPRPVLVVQSNAFGLAPNIIVALFTSVVDGEQQVRPRIEPDAINNLEEPSLLQVDILVTTPRHKFGRLIGRLAEHDQSRADQALLTFLGFAG